MSIDVANEKISGAKIKDKVTDRNKTYNTLATWQRGLLPIMAGIIIVLTIFFFSASFYQLYHLHKQIENNTPLDLARALQSLESTKDLDPDTRLNYVKWQTLVTLEGHALQRRYHQANVLLMSRVWIKYLGFVTGMILAFVGAVFILGKLREETSNLMGESKTVKVSFNTASPGLMMAFLGTVLMTLTILTRHQIDVKDVPLYVPELMQSVPVEVNSAPMELTPDVNRTPTTSPNDETLDILNSIEKEKEQIKKR